MKKIERKAYAKINLALDVTGRLPNGYHLVRMIMQTVDLYDCLSITLNPDEVSEHCPDSIHLTTNSGELPVNEDNLIYKACLLMKQRYHLTGSLQLHLDKHIPIAAGMAGGSTDAAAAILGLCELYEINPPMAELMELAVTIGADVPYCLIGGTVLAEGIGEKLTVLPSAPDFCLLIAKPDISVSTPAVYKALDATPIHSHPDVDGMIQAITSGHSEGIIQRLGNVLEAVTLQTHPVIQRIKEHMMNTGASNCLMSGSGPTVFGIYPDHAAAQRARISLDSTGLARDLFVTTIKRKDNDKI